MDVERGPRGAKGGPGEGRAHRFGRLLEERCIILFDGAMGTELLRRGFPQGKCPEEWNVSHPEEVAAIHRAYMVAGADVVETNTFGGNRLKLAAYGLQDRVYELNYAGVKVAREAVGDGCLVAGSLGPTGEFLNPLGRLSEEEARAVFREQVEAFYEAGADLIVIETMFDLAEAKAALLAAREAGDLPVVCHMTFGAEGRTLMGTDPETAAKALEESGASAVGANCSTGPREMVDVVARMARVARVPVIAQPNAGVPSLVEGHMVYPETPETMATYIPKFVEAGVRLLGGCCGTTPEHIRAIRETLESMGIL